MEWMDVNKSIHNFIFSTFSPDILAANCICHAHQLSRNGFSLVFLEVPALVWCWAAWEKTHEGNSSGLDVVAMERRGQWSRSWLSSAPKSKTAGLLSGWMLVVWSQSRSSSFFAFPNRNRKVPQASQSDRDREFEISHKLPPTLQRTG